MLKLIGEKSIPAGISGSVVFNDGISVTLTYHIRAPSPGNSFICITNRQVYPCNTTITFNYSFTNDAVALFFIFDFGGVMTPITQQNQAISIVGNDNVREFIICFYSDANVKDVSVTISNFKVTRDSDCCVIGVPVSVLKKGTLECSAGTIDCFDNNTDTFLVK